MRLFLLFTILFINGCASLKQEATIDILDDKTLLACNYSSLDEAKIIAYHTALDISSSQNISANSRTSCQSSRLFGGCVNELDISNIMNDTKVVNTKKVGACYAFIFKKAKNFTKVQLSEHNGSYDNSHSLKGESVLRINIINSSTLVKTKIDGEVYWINGQRDFEFYGPKTLNIEIVDDRFVQKKLTVFISRKPQIITKNISVVLKDNFSKENKNNSIGKGFSVITSLKNYYVIKNTNQFDASYIARQNGRKHLKAKDISTDASIGISITNLDSDNKRFIVFSIPKSIEDSIKFYWMGMSVYGKTPKGLGPNINQCVNNKLVMTVYGEEFSKIVTIRLPFTTCIDGDYKYFLKFGENGFSSGCEFNRTYCNNEFNNFTRHSTKLTNISNEPVHNESLLESSARNVDHLGEIKAITKLKGKFNITKVELKVQ